MNLSEIGAHVGSGVDDDLQIGVYLPGITAVKGYQVVVQVIHKADQFDPSVPATELNLNHVGGPYDLWNLAVQLTTFSGPGNLGQPGVYFYRFSIYQHGSIRVNFFNDPFARDSGPGHLAAFEYPAPPPYSWQDGSFVVPIINDVIMYELMVDDFAKTFAGVVERLDYLASLGVNCIELMPVSNVLEPYRWGYMPLSHMTIEERYGGTLGLKRLVDICHQRGIAVIHDAVYAHAHNDFCYNRVYRELGEYNPMMGYFAGDMFGEGTHFGKPFTQEYFALINDYFLTEFHMDGFRYDYVPGYYDGPVGQGYAKLVYETYQKSKAIARFHHQPYSRIIQVAEHLEMPKDILRKTYTNGSKRWWPMLKAQDMIKSPGSLSEGFLHDMTLLDINDPWPTAYPGSTPEDSFPVSTLQFIESHDKSRLMYFLTGWHGVQQSGFDLFHRDRSEWYRLQPLAIALMTSVGVPLLWQGQEFGEIYGKPDDGGARVLAGRPLHWEFFYEEGGRQLVNLYRRLGQLRKSLACLRSNQAYYYYQHSMPQYGLAVYSRISQDANEPDAMVLLNFGADEGVLHVPFPKVGAWEEQLNGDNEIIQVTDTASTIAVNISSHYGKLFVL